MVVVVDDILHGLDSLSSFHVLTCLSVFAKKNNRIVVVSLKSPRSDLYQLLDRVTILFYGEAFYSGLSSVSPRIPSLSGRTKDLPGYFRDAGFPCPSAENPAMYYRESDWPLVDTRLFSNPLDHRQRSPCPFY